MPLKKVDWGDIPNDIYVKDEDDFGKWIECIICDVKISIRSQFCFTEWETHCSGVRHCKIVNSKALQHVRKIDTFFKKRPASEQNVSKNSSTTNQSLTKHPKINTCPGFLWEKNRFVTSL